MLYGTYSKCTSFWNLKYLCLDILTFPPPPSSLILNLPDLFKSHSLVPIFQLFSLFLGASYRGTCSRALSSVLSNKLDLAPYVHGALYGFIARFRRASFACPCFVVDSTKLRFGSRAFRSLAPSWIRRTVPSCFLFSFYCRFYDLVGCDMLK